VRAQNISLKLAGMVYQGSPTFVRENRLAFINGFVHGFPSASFDHFSFLVK
jgi:hypothetical protein